MISRSAVLDSALVAQILSRRPLRYAAGGDEEADRPAHVRAASSLAWINDRIALVQDDANFVALVQLEPLSVQSIALPRGEAGLRQFDDLRGNKKFKLDLEACAAMSGSDGPVLMALGSGSKKRRRRIAMIDQWDHESPRVQLTDATSLYERLETETAFAGSDMNLEGAMIRNERLWLFGRGNGKARNGLLPLNATCQLALNDLLQYLTSPEHTPPPEPNAVTQYALGFVGGIGLGFTDATPFGDGTLYCATAEASKDATEDGLVAGSVLGVIDEHGAVRYAPLVDSTGALFVEKVEGVLLSRTSPNRAYLVIDPDDATRPSELCEVELRGSWTA